MDKKEYLIKDDGKEKITAVREGCEEGLTIIRKTIDKDGKTKTKKEYRSVDRISIVKVDGIEIYSVAGGV